MILLVKIFAAITTWTLVQSIYQNDKIFFLEKTSEKGNETLLVVTWIEGGISAGCEIFRDKDLINEVLISSRDSPIRTLSGDEFNILLQDCTEFILRRRRRETDDSEEENEALTSDLLTNDPAELSRQETNRRQNRRTGRVGNNTQNNRQRRRRTSTTSTTTISNAIETTTVPTTTLGYDGLPVIYPGTKWCGAGAVARNYDDLGTHEETDRCCRAHDLCNDTLAPGETRYNLTNTSPFTKLSCECDREFYDCLSRVNSFTSNSIGNMYFNILRRDCYKKEYPLTKKCKRYLTLLKITCMEYERNRRAPKVYQWIPAKQYRNIG